MVLVRMRREVTGRFDDWLSGLAYGDVVELSAETAARCLAAGTGEEVRNEAAVADYWRSVLARHPLGCRRCRTTFNRGDEWVLVRDGRLLMAPQHPACAGARADVVALGTAGDAAADPRPRYTADGWAVI